MKPVLAQKISDALQHPFYVHSEGRQHKTGITACQQVSGIEQMRMCVSKRNWTSESPVCLRFIDLSWSY